MANIFQRLFGVDQKRGMNPPPIPSRADTVVTVDTALSLTAVYRSVQILGNPVSKMEIETYRFAGGVEERISNPLLINNPNINGTRREFLFETVASLALNGECFWFKQYDSRNQVSNIIVLPAHTVGVRYENETITSPKVFDYDGKTYTTREIEHLKLFSRAGVLRGISPIDMCRPDIAAAMDLRDYAANWFKDGGVPTGVLTTNAMLSPEQADETTRRWHEKQAKRQIAVLGNGFAYDPVALSPKDALFTDVQSQSVQAIARLFGIPARLLLTGVDGTSDTYSNLTDEDAIFLRHTLTGYLDVIADALSRCLPRGQRVKFNYDSLYKMDMKYRYEAYKIGVEGGWLTVEDVQMKEEGLD